MQACRLCPVSQQSPTFGRPGSGFVEDSFSMNLVREDGFGMIQVHCTYCALYFYYYYISSTSDSANTKPRLFTKNIRH